MLRPGQHNALYLRLLFGLAVALLAVLPAQAARQALVLGNDHYTSVSKLQKAGNDATAMARELKAAGFVVQLHHDLNYRAMVRAVESFTSGIKGGDEVVVFFAGHGVQIKNGTYLLPTDIEAASESEVQQTAYELSLLMDKLSDARAAFSLVLVDACRDNPLKVRGRSVGSTRGLSAVEPPKGQMVVYSASKGQQALDSLSDQDANPNSVFTREFIARMKRPGVRIEDLVREVQDAVEALAGTVQHEQRPALYNEARGNFYFFGPATTDVAQDPPARTEATVVTAAQVEQQAWAAAQGGNTAAGYAAYLAEYPKGLYAAAARVARATVGTLTVGQSTVQDGFSARPMAAVVAGPLIKDCADCPEMVAIPSGSFSMGSREHSTEQPVRRVAVQTFLLGRTEITQRQWRAVMGGNPSYYTACGDDCPVENVSWHDAQVYATQLSLKTGKTYRLPTEAEWEYAARAGGSARWHFGDDGNLLVKHAWLDVNSGNKTHPVALKNPNPFGLHDMYGNVWEWVQDVWHADYDGAPAEASAWMAGGASARRVRRGGAWSIGSFSLRSANRFHGTVDNRGGSTGMRIARTH